MEILIKASQLILSLSILVILHELGHFIPAKLFKTRVEKFYLFFNPWFALFKTKIGETEYGIGWLPLGGYVKISGMVDESMDKEQMAQEPQPWEFRSKPAWQRLIIMLGGVTVNLFLGFFIYAMVLFAYGEQILPNKNLKDGVWAISELAQEVGFQNGDKIISIRGNELAYFEDLMPELLYGGSVVIERNGTQQTIEIPANFVEKIADSGKKGLFFFPRVPFVINQVPDSSINAGLGLQTKDKITEIAGTSIRYFDEAKTVLKQHAGQEVSLTYERNNSSTTVTAQISPEGFLEVAPLIMDYNDMNKAGVYEFENKEYSLISAIPAGWNKAVDKLSFYVKQFKLIFNPETGAYKGLGGFGAIGGMFPATWDWLTFWEITAFLSLILAFMNILPIPALDGGHVLFLLFEMISGRKPSDKFLEKAQLVGMAILLSLMVFANGNDIFRSFFK